MSQQIVESIKEQIWGDRAPERIPENFDGAIAAIAKLWEIDPSLARPIEKLTITLIKNEIQRPTKDASAG